MKKDIFISYRNDGEGNNFAARLFETLNEMEYNVYFNSNEQHSGSFPDRLRDAIVHCSDFLLIVSAGCLEGLRENRENDWVRTEILCALESGVSITPVYIGKTAVPDRWDDYPEKLRFLFALQSVYLPEQFGQAPIADLITKFKAKPCKDPYKDVANCNEKYDLKEDFAQTLARAESGDAVAMAEIGFMYYYGFSDGVSSDGKTDYAAAAKWLQKAAAQKTDYDPFIETLIGHLYYRGQMPFEDQSFRLAMAHYEKASEDPAYIGYLDKVMHMRLNGFEKACDYTEMTALYEKLKDKCLSGTKSAFARYFAEYGDFRRAVAILESIDPPYADTEYRLGLLYQRGVHCDPPAPDMFRAAEHLRNAAEMGSVNACYALGLIYFRGTNGYRRNPEKARACFKEAAEKGHSAASYNYAWMCNLGLGGEKNVDEALKHFENGAAGGEHLCALELAKLYQEPECRNYQKAFEHAKTAAAAGAADGEFVLANLYFFGRGCEADMHQAMRYYMKAYGHGIHAAKTMMERIKSLLD